MICAIHQPNFLPYLGFFEKVALSDTFVLYDTAQFCKNDYHNRNRIKTPHGAQWLTVPVHVRLGQPIRDVRVAYPGLVRSHLATLRCNYGKSRFFHLLFPGIERIYRAHSSGRLVDLNGELLHYLIDLLGLSTRLALASEMGLTSGNQGSKAIAEVVEKVGADTYLSGAGARAYLDEESLVSQGIKVIWQNYEPTKYDQRWGPFVPNLSVLDAILNVGPTAVKRMIVVRRLRVSHGSSDAGR